MEVIQMRKLLILIVSACCFALAGCSDDSDEIIARSAFVVPFGTANNAGGAGRGGDGIDGRTVHISIVADSDIRGLLASPSRTDLLADRDVIDWGSRPTFRDRDGDLISATKEVTDGGDVIGRTYRNNDMVYAYVDNDAPVIVADNFNKAAFGDIEIVALGAAFSSLPRGRAIYTGYALGVGRGAGTNENERFEDKFEMSVNFADRRVTYFRAGNADIGRVTTDAITGTNLATVDDIRIDTNSGSFSGSINFASGTSNSDRQIFTNSEGEIHGQFHGRAPGGITGTREAIGVTGVFFSDEAVTVSGHVVRSTIGGFAGARDDR